MFLSVRPFMPLALGAVDGLAWSWGLRGRTEGPCADVPTPSQYL